MPDNRPTFSIVTAVYNVEAYLPDFIRSIEAQTSGLGRLQIIAVDDGSSDGSPALLEAWRARRPDLVTVVRQENGGPGAARNRGIDEATGDWVTFTDPDDMLDPGFFDAVTAFLRAHPDVEVLATKPLLLNERDGKIRDRHPRGRTFAVGTRVVDLRESPSTLAGSSTTSLYPLARLRALELRFEPRLRPTFEDGHFAARYMLALDAPRVGLVKDARYIYRRRQRLDSLTQGAWTDPGRYSTTLELGYLDLVARAKAARGSVPAWLQHVLLYELTYYLSTNFTIETPPRVLPALLPRFLEMFGEVAREIEPSTVATFDARPLAPRSADLILHGFAHTTWHARRAVISKRDAVQGLQRVEYRFTGQHPVEAVRVDGTVVAPAYAKTVAVPFYGRATLFERLLWVPMGKTLALTLGGAPASVSPDLDRPTLAPAPAARPEDRAGRRDRGRSAIRARARDMVETGRRRWRRLRLHVLAWRRGFIGAWVLMDRVDAADDNAERLFEHLRAARVDINAWYVVEKGTDDWRRLRRAYGERVIAYGSIGWKALMLHASWLVSSQTYASVTRPRAIARLQRHASWRFAFVQHGVIKDDLSLWLNSKSIDLFVLSTTDELASVADDGTAYRFTHKEARNTGLPRFDRLLALGRPVAPVDRSLVLFAPTWRAGLADPPRSGALLREVSERFWTSDFHRAWSTLLRSPQIAEAARRQGLQLGFMPHPQLQPVLARFQLPDEVVPLSFAGVDVQDRYAHTAVLVTDYSSVAFNLAVIDRSVVYYQFDRDDEGSGAHIGRPGYFDYERDGFGPVALDHEAAVDAIVAAIDARGRPSPEYQARIDRTFPNRDGHACERVVAAIEELSRPYRPAEAAES